MRIEKTDSKKMTEELNSTHPWAHCKPVQIGRFSIGGPSFTVVAGPCSIESESQFSETAQGVYNFGARLVRGGIWKLRTNPNSFQGLGSSGFSFIKEVCKKLEMPLVSEITDPRQIEQTLDVIDVIQVGSRNMHNYELLKELGKTNKPILLKRGFAAHVSEWLGAAEYILKGGNEKIILCERGIRTFETTTRNTLDLNAVVYLKRNTPFPVIVDPSHAVGVRALVPSLTLAAASAGADGVIVEVHPRPHEALSDGMQALTLRDFELMMKKLELTLAAIDRTLAK